MTTWTNVSDKCLDRIFRDIWKEYGDDADDYTLRKILVEGYPFGERKYWPYKCWLRRRRAWIHAYRNGLRLAPQEERRRTRAQVSEATDKETLDMFADVRQG